MIDPRYAGPVCDICDRPTATEVAWAEVPCGGGMAMCWGAYDCEAHRKDWRSETLQLRRWVGELEAERESTLTGARAIAAKHAADLAVAKAVLADLLSERRGSEVTEGDDEDTAMERIAAKYAERDRTKAVLADDAWADDVIAGGSTLLAALRARCGI